MPITPLSRSRATWQVTQHLGFAGGRALEPGMDIGLFFEAMPNASRPVTYLVGIKCDPVTSGAAKLHSRATMRA